MLYSLVLFILVVLCLVRPNIPEAEAATAVSYQELGRMNTPATNNASNRWFGIDFDKYKEFKGRYSGYMKFHARHLGENGPIFSAPEAYFDVHRGNTGVTYGRQIMNWNPHEQFWLLGDLNPQRGFNLLEQDMEGLAGIKLRHQQDNFSLELFGSYLYIPQLNPTYKIKDGKIDAPTEWSKLPPSSVFYNDAVVPIYYDLELPEMKTVLFQPSVGGRLSMNWNEKGGVSVYGLYKPENQVRFNATGFYEQDVEERARVRAKPFVNHHWIYGAEVEQSFGDIQWQLGAMAVIPEKGGDPTFEFEPLKIEPVYEDYIYGFNTLKLEQDEFSVAVHHIESFSPPGQEENVFGKKIHWQSATGIQGTYLFNDKWSSNVSYRYDWQLGDIQLVGAVTYKMSRNAAASLGLEMLEVPNKNSYWSSFRSNDTSYARLNYAF